jgi:cephalosporin-C deacetylase-like acetyl esterase
MTEPDDYGLSPIETLAHVGDATRSLRHGAFWKTWSAAVFSQEPALSERGARDEDPSDPSATHQFESARHVRIGAALRLPAGRIRAGLVALHGYGEVPHLAQSSTRWEGLVARGVAVLVIRVRGYPGSRLDAANLAAVSEARGGGAWITLGLEEPICENGCGCEWSFSYAVADVVNAYRALRALLSRSAGGSRLPVFIHGESFGGALAVTAASALADHDEPARLALGVPSMGDWAWRLAEDGGVMRAGYGSGQKVKELLRDRPERAIEMTNTLRVLDTVIHARRVRCPVLCKLATRDDVVPAPTAAAVFNALATPPGEKWRHVTRFGHWDGGIADARRHAEFEARVDAFLDPGADPLDSMGGAP